MLTECTGLLKTKDELATKLDQEVSISYAKHSSGSDVLVLPGLQALEQNATFILSKSAVSLLSYPSQSLQYFKAKLFKDETRYFSLDSGIQNGAEIELTIPKAALEALNYADQYELISIVFQKGLYDKEYFPNWECPVLSLSISRNQAIDSELAKHFQEPLTIEFRIKGQLPKVKISGAYWNGASWSTKDITTRLSGTSAFI